MFRSYGSTEHPSITGCLLDEPEEKRLTHRRPRRSPASRSGSSEDGEILSRGPDCCLGYTDPALTAAAFDADGWYRTGDVGVLDGDGYLTITDRISDIIIRGGENISAQEIEELLLGLDAVAEVAVVAEPDARLGEHAAAVVTRPPGHDRAHSRTGARPPGRRRSGPPEVARVDPRGRASSPARRRARSRSSGSASCSARGGSGLLDSENMVLET